VTGTVGGETVHKTYSSEGFRGALDLWSGLVGIDGQDPPFAPPPVTVRRRAGTDRVGTAIQLSRSGWDASDVVLLARSDDPADALAGSGLAGALDAPLLLTSSTTLLDTVQAELARLGATKVVLLGGPVALSDDVATALKDLGLDVDRIAGADRFATAVEVARRLAPEAGGTALLVRGAFAGHPERSWPDALAVSGLAARKAAAGTPWPILATAGKLPDVTRSALDELGITTVKIIGGTAVIDAATETALTDAGFEVERIGGADRYGTSRLVAARDDPTGQQLVLATGQDFPDGLASGPFAARSGAVLLLVPKELHTDSSPWGPDQHPAFLQGLGWSQSVVTVAGGSAAITEPVAEQVKAILKAATSSATATASPSPSPTDSTSPTPTDSTSPTPTASPSPSASSSPSPSPSAS
jgi:putative cell wall-binding protein